MKHNQTAWLRKLAVAIVLALTLPLAGCDDTLDPELASLNGTWILHFGHVQSDFRFDLREEAGGIVNGTWSNPAQFAFNRAWGKREGLKVSLNADSPNLLPATVDATFIREGRLEGIFRWGGEDLKVNLIRQ